MKKKILLFLLVMVLILSFAGCGKQQGPLVGKWAYVHDETTTVLELASNGKAVYEGNSYTYTNDDQFIILKDKNGNENRFRYVIEKDGFLFYKTTEYVNKDNEAPSSIVGVWTGKEVDKWSFEFTENGEFMEDGYFPGYYTIDENAKTVKLVYNDHFEDTICYYQKDGNELTIEYPWKMVQAK